MKGARNFSKWDSFYPLWIVGCWGLFCLAGTHVRANEDLPLPVWDSPNPQSSGIIVPQNLQALEQEPEGTLRIDQFLKTGEVESILREGQLVNSIDRAFQLFVPSSQDERESSKMGAVVSSVESGGALSFQEVTREQVEDSIFLVGSEERYLYFGRQLNYERQLSIRRFVEFLQGKLHVDLLLVQVDPDQVFSEDVPWRSYLEGALSHFKGDGFILLVGETREPFRLLLRGGDKGEVVVENWREILGKSVTILNHSQGDYFEALMASLTEFAVGAIRNFGEKGKVNEPNPVVVETRKMEGRKEEGTSQAEGIVTVAPVVEESLNLPKTGQVLLSNPKLWQLTSLFLMASVGGWWFCKKRKLQLASLSLSRSEEEDFQILKKLSPDSRVCSRSGFTCSFARGKGEV